MSGLSDKLMDVIHQMYRNGEVPKHEATIARLEAELAGAKEIVRWPLLESMTCWHKKGNFRVMYFGGTADCPACKMGALIERTLEGYYKHGLCDRCQLCSDCAPVFECSIAALKANGKRE